VGSVFAVGVLGALLWLWFVSVLVIFPSASGALEDTTSQWEGDISKPIYKSITTRYLGVASGVPFDAVWCFLPSSLALPMKYSLQKVWSVRAKISRYVSAGLRMLRCGRRADLNPP
jgi:hypothetical protein